MGNEQSAGGLRSNLPQGMQAMGSQLQRKFAKGVQYNMKVIIKGDRNTGKTCLLRRLQGDKFYESYTPTQEIQAASIHWNYRASDDVVKVEVWDVVDKGVNAQRKQSDALKLQNENSAEQADESAPNLDAGFLDVYKNTNGVIMLLDICKAWTWKYVQREIDNVPIHVPIIILGNFRDMGEHRVIDREEVEYFVKGLDRPEEAGEIHYAEVSMKNAFGLKYLHKFFNLPFLRLQRATLLSQLRTNEEDLNSTLEELNFHLESEEQNYDVFMTGLEKRRKEFSDRIAQQKAAEAGGVAGAVAPGTPPTHPLQQQQRSSAADLRAPATAAASTAAPAHSATRASATAGGAATAATAARSGAAPPPATATAPASGSGTSSAPPPATSSAPVPTATSGAPTPSSATNPQVPQGQSFGQRFASKLGWRRGDSMQNKPTDDAAAQLAAAREDRLRNPKPTVQENVEDFVPEGGLADDFLADDAGAGVVMGHAVGDEDDSDDDVRPAVAGFDDYESDDNDDAGPSQAAQVAAPIEDVSDDDDDYGDTPAAVIAADDDVSSISGPAVAADEDDFDSEPSPEPVKKVIKPAKTQPAKPIVFEDVVVADPVLAESPPVLRQASSASPQVKQSKSKSPKEKKKKAKKPVVYSSSEPSDSDDEGAGPVVAPLEGDSDDEIKVDKVVPVEADDDGLGPAVNQSTSTHGFMEHWLDGGTMDQSQFTAPAEPVSAASLLAGGGSLMPEVLDSTEKVKKKKKKKTADARGEAEAADGVEKKKKKKKASSAEGGEEVKKKRKKKSKTETPDGFNGIL